MAALINHCPDSAMEIVNWPKQPWLSPELYPVTWIALLVIVVFVPTHALLIKLRPNPDLAAAKLA